MAGSRSLGTLTIDLIAKIAGFEQGMDKAERSLDKRAKRMNDVAKKIGIGIGAAITAGIAAGGALAIMTKQAIDNADAMRDMSIRFDESTETLSVYGYAASQTGTDIDTLAKGLKVLSKNAADSLNPTSEQSKVFKALGIDVADAEGRLKSLSVLVPEIADRFKTLEDGTTKAALAQALFGKAGLDLTEFLNQGSQGLDEFTAKAQALGIVIDDETAAAADELNDTLGDLTRLSEGYALHVAKELLPDMQALASEFSNTATEGNKVKDMAEGTAQFLRGLATVAGMVSSAFELVGTGAATIAAQGVALGKILTGDLSEGMALYREAAAGFNAEVDEALGRDKTVAKKVKLIFAGEGPDPAGLFKESPQEAALRAQSKDLERRLAIALSNPTEVKAKGGKSEAEKLAEAAARAAKEAADAQYQWNQSVLDMEASLAGPVAEAQREYARNITELNHAFNTGKVDLADYAKAQELYAEQRDRDLKAIEDRRTPAQYMLEDLALEAELLGKTREQQELLNAARYLGAEAATEQGQAALKALEDLQAQSKAIQEQVDILDGARDSARGFLDDLREGEGVWNSLKNAADSFAETLYNLAADRIIEQLFGQRGSTQTGSSGGWLGALFGGGSGSSQGSLMDLFSGSWGFAGGGTMGPNSVARVNERGFEMATVNGNDYLLTGNKSVEITPHERLRSGSGSVTQQFIVQGVVDGRTSSQMAGQAGTEARRALARNGA